MSFTIGGNQGGGGDFAKPEAGRYYAVCAAIYDIGIQTSEWQGQQKKSAKCAMVWELEAQDPDGNPHILIDTLPLSLFKASKMREAVTALLGKAVSEDDEIDPGTLVGKSAMLTVDVGGKGSPFIERRDALQDASRGLTVQGSYGPSDDIHKLVAWLMREAVDGTVPGDQGLMELPPASTAAAVDNSAPADDSTVPF